MKQRCRKQNCVHETRADLVSRVSSMGAEIPTTSMHWKHVAFDLEWIVRQMSWSPPWNAPKEKGPKLRKRRRTSTSLAAAPPDTQSLPAPGGAAPSSTRFPEDEPTTQVPVKDEIHSDAASSSAEGNGASVHSTPEREDEAHDPEHGLNGIATEASPDPTFASEADILPRP